MPNATWGSIAYTQYGVLPLMQTAAFAGIWGIIFLMTWSASTLDLAFADYDVLVGAAGIAPFSPVAPIDVCP